MNNIISIGEKFSQKRDQIKIVVEPEIANLLHEINDLREKLDLVKEKYKELTRMSKRKYNEQIGNIDIEFELALYKEYGIENNPNREKIFSAAWEKGHPYGYSSVEQEFANLVELHYLR